MIMRTYSKDFGSTGTGLWGNGIRLLPALLHFALMPFRKAIVCTPALLHSCILIFLLASCSSDDAPEPAAAPEPTATVQLYLSVPEAAATRIGDPGSPTGEGIDWDELALMIEYTDEQGKALPAAAYRHYLKTISKEEFDLMPRLSGDTAVRVLSLDIPAGDVYIYGVTYSSEADEELTDGETLSAKFSRWDTDNGANLTSLTISNSYAAGSENSLAKFLSVATGYYQDDAGNRKLYSIRLTPDGEVGQKFPIVRLVRLAAKIDIQWDAQAAYDNESHSYVDVRVTDFAYNGGATGLSAGDKGSGRLFPALSEDESPLGGTSTFYNETEISQRNGREYHYVFPDGSTGQTITFNISAENGRTKMGYTIRFSGVGGLQPATWYKVNATIRGLAGSGETTLMPDNTLGG